MIHLRPAQAHEVANFLDRAPKILHDFVVGEPQHGIAAERKFIVAVPVADESPSRRVVGIAVELDHEPHIYPNEGAYAR